jgi:hypothetical protein
MRHASRLNPLPLSGRRLLAWLLPKRQTPRDPLFMFDAPPAADLHPRGRL